MKTSPCGRAEAQFRLAQARGHLGQAGEAAVGRLGPAWPNLVASGAVLAGIAAADAICCSRSGQRAASESHQDAVALFRRALPTDKKNLATTLGRLLSVKTPAQYGARPLSASMASTALRQATQLVEAAEALAS